MYADTFLHIWRQKLRKERLSWKCLSGVSYFFQESCHLQKASIRGFVWHDFCWWSDPGVPWWRSRPRQSPWTYGSGEQGCLRTYSFCIEFLKICTPWKINMKHNSLEVWFRSFSFLNGLFVGEPAVHLPGCRCFGIWQVRFLINKIYCCILFEWHGAMVVAMLENRTVAEMKNALRVWAVWHVTGWHVWKPTM